MQKKTHSKTCLIVHLINQLYKRKQNKNNGERKAGMIRNKYLKKSDFSISLEILEKETFLYLFFLKHVLLPILKQHIQLFNLLFNNSDSHCLLNAYKKVASFCFHFPCVFVAHRHQIPCRHPNLAIGETALQGLPHV